MELDLLYSIDENVLSLIVNENLLNENILVLIDKIDYLTAIQFNFLTLSLSIIILVVIYSVIKKFLF